MNLLLRLNASFSDQSLAKVLVWPSPIKSFLVIFGYKSVSGWGHLNVRAAAHLDSCMFQVCSQINDFQLKLSDQLLLNLALVLKGTNLCLLLFVPPPRSLQVGFDESTRNHQSFFQ